MNDDGDDDDDDSDRDALHGLHTCCYAFHLLFKPVL